MNADESPLVENYLWRLRTALAGRPADRRREITGGITQHLAPGGCRQPGSCHLVIAPGPLDQQGSITARTFASVLFGLGTVAALIGISGTAVGFCQGFARRRPRQVLAAPEIPKR